MKKLFSLLLCLVLVFPLAVSALADVIWEPADSFYEMHSEDCVYTNSLYEAQNDAEIRKDPESNGSVGTVAKGEVVQIDYAWPGESVWGYIEEPDRAGWVSLSDFRRLYNADDFYLDHTEEITEDEGTVARKAGGTVVVWTFPGSGTVAGLVTDNAAGEDDIAYTGTWTAEDGTVWGKVPYYYGLRGWVCISDPAAEDLPATAPHYAEESPEVAAEPAAGPSVPVLAIVLVAAVVLVTAAAIILLTRKKRA